MSGSVPLPLPLGVLERAMLHFSGGMVWPEPDPRMEHAGGWIFLESPKYPSLDIIHAQPGANTKGNSPPPTPVAQLETSAGKRQERAQSVWGRALTLSESPCL